MDTAAIRYRVADFLKQHPPFTAMEERDLVALAANGRVRFHEVNEFILWQGEPHKAHVFVIQQGTVSIWDEHTGEAALRDVRGAGDLLGAEQFNGARSCLFSARAAADVVLYGFPAEDFGELLEKYPYARQFVDALGTVATEFQRAGGSDERSDPRRMFLHDVASPLQACTPDHSVADAARMLALTGAEALAVTGADAQLLGLVTTNALLSWIADGGGSADRPIAELGLGVPPTLGPDASIADGVIAMGNSAAAALAMTADGTSAGRLLAVVTPRDLAPVFGDAPAAILRDVGRASDLQALRTLNQRARACALQYLTSAGSTDWIVRFIESVDLGILRRLIAMTSAGEAEACWCVCGASGRGESVTRRQPHLIVIGDDRVDQQALIDHHARVVDALAQCDYLPEGDGAADAASAVAGAAEWSRRYRAWIENPVMERMAQSRSLFDLRPFHGDRGLVDRDPRRRGGDRSIATSSRCSRTTAWPTSRR